MPDTNALDAFVTFSEDSAIAGEVVKKIVGETKDSVERDYTSMQVISYAFGSSNSGEWTDPTATAGERNLQAPSIDNVTIDKMVDSGTPSLFEALCLGCRYKNVWLWQRRAGGAAKASGDYFFKVTLGDVVVASQQIDSDTPPKEKLSLHFNEIWVEYISQKVTGDMTKTPIVGYWHREKSQDPRYNKGKAKEAEQMSGEDLDKRIDDRLKRLGLLKSGATPR